MSWNDWQGNMILNTQNKKYRQTNQNEIYNFKLNFLYGSQLFKTRYELCVQKQLRQKVYTSSVDGTLN